MKRLLVVALVVVVLFTGLPVVIGMSGMECADCELAVLLGSACVFAVMAVNVGLALARRGVRLRASPPVFEGLLTTTGLYRPPRLV